MSKCIDEVVEICIRHQSIDTAVALCEFAVDAIRPQQDLQRPPASDQPWQTGRWAAARRETDPDLPTGQHHLFAAGEADIAGECDLAA